MVDIDNAVDIELPAFDARIAWISKKRIVNNENQAWVTRG